MPTSRIVGTGSIVVTACHKVCRPSIVQQKADHPGSKGPLRWASVVKCHLPAEVARATLKCDGKKFPAGAFILQSPI